MRSGEIEGSTTSIDCWRTLARRLAACTRDSLLAESDSSCSARLQNFTFHCKHKFLRATRPFAFRLAGNCSTNGREIASLWHSMPSGHQPPGRLQACGKFSDQKTRDRVSLAFGAIVAPPARSPSGFREIVQPKDASSHLFGIITVASVRKSARFPQQRHRCGAALHGLSRPVGAHIAPRSREVIHSNRHTLASIGLHRSL